MAGRGDRRLTRVMTALHFAPTETARANLLMENIAPDKVFVTGSTVIDALLIVRDRINADAVVARKLHESIGVIDKNRRSILVTGHRRENFGEAFREVLSALKTIAEQNPDVQIIFPVHLNPAVKGPVHEMLAGISNVSLIEPLDYLAFIYLLKSCYLVITDSGGIQEEAPSLGKPVLVAREVTERPEAVDAGTVRLVGTDDELIVSTVNTLLSDQDAYMSMNRAINLYGDGRACQRIAAILSDALLMESA